MANEFQPVRVGARAGVATELIRCNSDNEGGQLILHPVGQDWTVARYKEEYHASLDSRSFCKMFSVGRDKRVLDRRAL